MSSVQSAASRVHHPESSIQSPMSNSCVQSPGIPVCQIKHKCSSKIHKCSFIELGSEVVVQRCSVTKGVLRNFVKFTGKHLCQESFLNKVAGFATLSKKTLAQMLSSEFCEISWNTFCYKTPPVAASVGLW